MKPSTRDMGVEDPTAGFSAWFWVAALMFVAGLTLGPRLFNGPVALHFPGVQGPNSPTIIPPTQPATWRSYAQGGVNRLAVLLTDTTSSWLGLAHGLKSAGVPFRFTTDHNVALAHDVVLVYPTVSGTVLSRTELQALAAFPRSGGTLIGTNVEGGGLGDVFGYSNVVPSRARATLELDPDHPISAAFTHPNELSIPFADPTRGELSAGSFGYGGVSDPVAVFPDGTAAITARRVGAGSAYALGIDVGFLLVRGYGNREEGVSRSYANEFEPALDVLLRLLTLMYQGGDPQAVLVDPVPDGRPLAALITHDIDYGASLANAVTYAEWEDSIGIPSTYFVQTKYVEDWNDRAFLDEGGQEALRSIERLGREIGSHSVAHSLQFNDAPIGTGDEQYPAYQPVVRDPTRTDGLSLLGELRVSKFLIETFVPSEEVVSFRPGHLRNPYESPEALEATGYRFSSSVTAGNSQTHLPFRLTESRGATTQSGTYEFPVTIEDEAEPPLAERLDGALEVADAVARYGGLFQVLIHTDEVEQKLDFERRLVSALRERDAWFGDLRTYGDFWVARDAVTVDVTTVGAPSGESRLEIAIDAPRVISGLTLTLPAGRSVDSSVPNDVVRSATDGQVILNSFSGRALITLR